MNIEIKREVSDKLIEDYKRKFNVYYKKALLIIILFIVAGIGSIFYGISDKGEAVLDRGIFFIFVGLVSLIPIYRARMSNINNIKKFISRTPENNKEITISLLDDKFIHESFESKHQYNWGAFNRFKLNKTTLNLFLNDTEWPDFQINESELSKDKLLEFYKFLSTNPHKNN